MHSSAKWHNILSLVLLKRNFSSCLKQEKSPSVNKTEFKGKTSELLLKWIDPRISGTEWLKQIYVEIVFSQVHVSSFNSF